MLRTNSASGRSLHSALLPVLGVALLSLVVTFATGFAEAALAQEPEDSDPIEAEPIQAEPEAEPTEAEIARDEQLREGSQVYSQICASCHQAGGIGVVGQFPPLIGNENVDDADYVRGVINNGRSGQIEIDGTTYDGVMPSFSTLSDEDTEAVIAFVQNDFMAPSQAAIAPTGPIAGTELPALASFGALLAYLLAAAVALLVLAPRILGANDRLNTPWLDAWLKTAVIVIATIILTVVIPDWVIKRGSVTKLDRFVQDFIGVSLWLGGMAIILGGLWYLHRESRI